MDYTDEKTLDIRIFRSRETGFYGCNIFNTDGKLLFGQLPSFPTKEAALFHSLNQKAVGLAQEVKPDRERRCLWAGLEQMVFGDYSSAAFIREAILSLCYGYSFQGVTLHRVGGLDDRHFHLFDLIVMDYRMNGETEFLRETAKKILRLYPEHRKRFCGN